MKWILAVIMGALGAVLAGGALFLLDKVGFYLVLVMPIIAGALVGFASYLPTIRQRVPAAPLVIIALLAGILAVAVYWGALYLDYQNELVNLIQERDPRASREEALRLIDRVNRSDYGQTGFQGFLAEYAEAGISISRAGSSSTGVPLQGTAAYAFWGVEALLLIGMAVFMVFRREGNTLVKRYRPQEALPEPAEGTRLDAYERNL